MPNEIPQNPVPPATPPQSEKLVVMPDENAPAAAPDTFNLNAKKSDEKGQTLLEKLIGKKVDPTGKDTSNAFTELFKQGKGKAQQATASIAQLLGPKPTITKSEVLEEERKHSQIAHGFFYAACSLAIIVFAGSYVLLNPEAAPLISTVGLEPTVGVRFDQTNAEIRRQQTDINVLRFRKIRLMLDALNAQSDGFIASVTLSASENATATQKKDAVLAADKKAPELKELLKKIQKSLGEELGIDIFTKEPITITDREQLFEAQLVEKLTTQKNTLSSDAKTNIDEIRVIDNVVRLVQNKQLRTLMRLQNIDKLDNEKLAGLITKVRLEGGDEIAALEKLKAQRVSWSRLIADIHAAVRKADVYFGQGLFKTVGGFMFQSYRFDAKTHRISIAGVTKTSDSKTFSVIAKLIDSIEKSTKFKNIDFRSFAKARDADGDYSSGINLEFSVQDGPDPRDDVTPQTK